MEPSPGREWKRYAEHFGAGRVAGDRAWFHPALFSPQLERHREVAVWLPPSYLEGGHRYPTLYFQDGQNLLDRGTSFAGEWGIDESIEQAGAEREAIVVAVWNGGAERCPEYSPWDDPRHGPGRGEAYLRFLVETVKPLVDRSFRTLPEARHTTLGGSSMGALASLAGLMRHPETFGSAALFSPALWYAERAAFQELLERGLPGGRVYLDVGTEEGGSTLADAERLAALLRTRPEGELCYRVEEGARHEEAAWARRFPGALDFLLRPRAQEREESLSASPQRTRSR